MHFHFVPSGVLDTVTEQLKLQVSLFCFLLDICAHIITLFNELLLLRQVNHELIPFEFLDVGDFLVVRKQLSEFLLDDVQLFHDLFLEELFSLSVLLLELCLHHVSEEIHILHLLGLNFGQVLHLLRRTSKHSKSR